MAKSDSRLDPARVRQIKNEILKDSRELEKVVTQIVATYSRELDEVIEHARECIEKRDTLTDAELEKLTIKVPVYMYFAATGLELLGIQYDSSKTVKSSAYNKFYEIAEGTIGDKKASAELQTFAEQYMEIAFQRAYKQLKAKLDVCESLCLSLRKIIGKRTQEIQIDRWDGQVERGTR